MYEKSLMIIDGNSIINRAFYGIRQLNAKDGTPTNAVYGFLNILFKNIDEYRPDYLCVAFDIPKPTFRHKQYDAYKANRKPMPDDLRPQLPLAKEILSAMNIPAFELEGYEADDIIGTVSRECEQSGIKCYIVTGDKDDLQLASEHTAVLLTVTRMGDTQTDVMDAGKVKEKYNVTPEEFIDVKAIMGDTSDNIPGIKGIGEKGAFELIAKYKSLDYIYDNIDTIDVKPAMRTKLEQGRDVAFLSRQLATIDRNVPLDFNVQMCAVKEYDKDKLYSIFDRLQFKTLIKKLDLSADTKKANKAENVFENMRVVSVKDELNTVMQACLKSDILYYNIGVNSSLGKKSIKSVCINIKDDVYFIDTSAFDKDILITELKRVFESGVEKVTIDSKNDYILLEEYGIKLNNVAFDVSVGAYITDPFRTSYGIRELADDFLNVEIEEIQTVQQTMFDDDDTDNTNKSDAEKVYILKKLQEYIQNKIDENGQHDLYYNIELPLAKVLADMQIAGMHIDIDCLNQFSDELTKNMISLEQDIYDLAGEEFNINSPKQLAVILFEKLGLKSGKKTKTGYSTNADVLEKLKDQHIIIPAIMNYRQIAKLKSTYCDGFVNLINKDTHRIHSEFNQTVTATGRISSSEPNMQNIPVRTELGREIRRFFTVQSDDYVLVDADYSQIELRVLAHMANDKTMIQAFVNNEDIHAVTASQVFGVDLDKVTSKQRSSAKAVNFGIVYGIGEYSLSQDLGISVKEAKEYIQSYLDKYSDVKKYMHDIKQFAYENGYVNTLCNRRRYIPELKSSNYNVRAFGERVALNTPIQGTAADIIKIAMVRVHDRISKELEKSRLILQVHDELIVEAHKSEADKLCEIVKYEMENAMKLNVPLVVDMKCASNWYDAK